MIIVNIGTDKNASFRLIDVIYRFWLNEVNDIIDGFHYKVLIVDKLFFSTSVSCFHCHLFSPY